jgi:hypothetical protein
MFPLNAAAANGPQLEDAKGTVAASSLISGTNVGEIAIWNTEKTVRYFICNNATLTGEVTHNSGGTVKAKITKADIRGTGSVNADNSLNECTGELGSFYFTVKNLPLELSSTPVMATDEFQITGSGGAKVRLLLGSTTAGECEYEESGSTKGDYTTGTSTAEDATLTIRTTEAGSGMILIRGGLLCPASAMLGMTLTLMTDGTTEPIWANTANSNNPQLTTSGGLVAVGTRIAGTNVGSTVFWDTATNLKLSICNTAFLTGEVTANSGGTVEGKVTRADFSSTGATSLDDGLGECTGEIGNSYVTLRNLPLELKSTPGMANDEFQVTGSGGAKLKFLIGSTIAGECEYEVAAAIKGNYTTGASATEDAILTTRDTPSDSGATRIRGGFLCPTSGMLAMTFTLRTDPAGAAVWIS